MPFGVFVFSLSLSGIRSTAARSLGRSLGICEKKVAPMSPNEFANSEFKPT